jgi:hypothetical protein
MTSSFAHRSERLPVYHSHSVKDRARIKDIQIVLCTRHTKETKPNIYFIVSIYFQSECTLPISPCTADAPLQDSYPDTRRYNPSSRGNPGNPVLHIYPQYPQFLLPLVVAILCLESHFHGTAKTLQTFRKCGLRDSNALHDRICWKARWNLSQGRAQCYGTLAMCMIWCAGQPTTSKIRMNHTLVVASAFLVVEI